MRRSCILLFILALLTCSAHAAELPASEFGVDVLERSLPAAAADTYGDLSASDSARLSERLEQLWTSITGQGQDLFFSALRNAALLLLITLLTALGGVFTSSGVVRLCAVVAVSAVSLRHVSSCMSVGMDALQTLSDFSMVLLPCLSTAAAVSGAVTSAAAKYASTMLFLDGLLALMLRYGVAAMNMYLALMLSASLTENEMLTAIAAIAKQVLRWALILTAAGFTLYLSITGILSGTVDAAAAKTAKTVLSSALPVVGSIVSDASSALLSGAAMLRNGIGLLGLLAVLAVCVTPYLTLGVHCMVYRIAAGAAQAFSEKAIAGVIRSFSDVYGFLLGMVGVGTLMVFVSVISLMKAVVPG